MITKSSFAETSSKQRIAHSYRYAVTWRREEATESYGGIYQAETEGSNEYSNSTNLRIQKYLNTTLIFEYSFQTNYTA